MTKSQILRMAVATVLFAAAGSALAGDLTLAATNAGNVDIDVQSNLVTATNAGGVFDTENNSFNINLVLVANQNHAGAIFINTGDPSVGSGDLTVLDSLDFYDPDFTGTNALELSATNDIVFQGTAQHNSLTGAPLNLTLIASNNVSLVASPIQAHLSLGGGWLNVQSGGLASLHAAWTNLGGVDVYAGSIDANSIEAHGNLYLSAETGSLTTGNLSAIGTPGDDSIQLSSEGQLTVNGDISGGRLDVRTNSGNASAGTTVYGSLQIGGNIDFSGAGPILIGGRIDGIELAVNGAAEGDTFESGEIVVDGYAELRAGGDVRINGTFEARTGHISSNNAGFGSPLFETDLHVDGAMLASTGIELFHRSVFIGDLVRVMPPEAQSDTGFYSSGAGTFEAMGSVYAHTGAVNIDHQGDITLHGEVTADFNSVTVHSQGAVSAQAMTAEFDVSVGSYAGTVTTGDVSARFGTVNVESNGNATLGHT